MCLKIAKRAKELRKIQIKDQRVQSQEKPKERYNKQEQEQDLEKRK